MRLTLTKILAVLAALSCTASPTVNACTGLKLKAKDGNTVHGRTLEFGVVVDTSVVVVPRGYAFEGTSPEGRGLDYTAKYGAVGIIAFGNPSIMDGINEKGLAVGTFYFSGFADYATITKDNQSKALSPVEFSNWLITQFATIEEVKEGLTNVVIAPTVSKAWGPTPPPFHYIVYDKSGNSLVIEPLKGKLVTYDNPLGTFTNSPTFDWHLTNLSNFINLTTENPKPLVIDGMKFAPFGEGYGMVGLPGDFSPPSRFVQAAIFSITATPVPTAKEAIFQTFHLLNQFDIPVGVAKEKVGDIVNTDYTQFTCARDPQDLKYFFRTYDDQTIRYVDLKTFDLNAKKIKSFKTSQGVQAAFDISADLK